MTVDVRETSPYKGGLTGESSSQDSEVDFAHPSEGEFARILDFYGVRWQYEGVSPANMPGTIGA